MYDRRSGVSVFERMGCSNVRCFTIVWILIYTVPALLLFGCFGFGGSGTGSHTKCPKTKIIEVPIGGTANITSTDDPTIYVTISAYRDVYCTGTMDSIFENAAKPHRIRVGVVAQYNFSNPTENCELSPHNRKYNQWVRRFEIPYWESKGPCFARWAGSRMYQKETYFMQIDAHSLVIPNWDEKIIEMYLKCPKRKAILTSHPAAIEPHYHEYMKNIQKERPLQWVPHVCRYNIDGDELPRYEGVLVDRWSPPKPAPFLTPFVGAGLIFGAGQWVEDVPFDPFLDYLFSGEELLHSVRLWTAGWEIYTPNWNVVFHNYNRKENPSNVWADYSGNNPINHSWRTEQLWALKRLRYILARLNKPHDRDKDMSEAERNKVFKHIEKYGLGKEKTLEQFMDYAKINWVINPSTGPTGANKTQPDREWWCSEEHIRSQ